MQMICERTPGGYSPSKGVRGRAAIKTPFSGSLSSSLRLDPHFSMFKFFETPFSTKITKFAALEPKLTKIPFQSLKLGKNLVP